MAVIFIEDKSKFIRDLQESGFRETKPTLTANSFSKILCFSKTTNDVLTETIHVISHIFQKDIEHTVEGITWTDVDFKKISDITRVMSKFNSEHDGLLKLGFRKGFTASVRKKFKLFGDRSRTFTKPYQEFLELIKRRDHFGRLYYLFDIRGNMTEAACYSKFITVLQSFTFKKEKPTGRSQEHDLICEFFHKELTKFQTREANQSEARMSGVATIRLYFTDPAKSAIKSTMARFKKSEKQLGRIIFKKTGRKLSDYSTSKIERRKIWKQEKQLQRQAQRTELISENE